MKLHVAQAELTNLETRGPDEACGVVQTALSDGRRFSILAATPGWFRAETARLGLRYYFGPAVLFLRNLDPVLARAAVAKMLSDGDRWLCRYDTPRVTLPQVLADFAARHPAGRTL